MLKVLHQWTTMVSNSNNNSSLNKRFLSLQEYLSTGSQILLHLGLVSLEASFWMKRFLMTQMLHITPTRQFRVSSMLESRSPVRGEAHRATSTWPVHTSSRSTEATGEPRRSSTSAAWEWMLSPWSKRRRRSLWSECVWIKVKRFI